MDIHSLFCVKEEIATMPVANAYVEHRRCINTHTFSYYLVRVSQGYM